MYGREVPRGFIGERLLDVDEGTRIVASKEHVARTWTCLSDQDERFIRKIDRRGYFEKISRAERMNAALS